MEPYYNHDGITIYHGDCLDVMPRLQAVDLLLTDPPYGIGEAAGKNKSRSRLAIATDYGNHHWDESPAEEGVTLARSLSRSQMIFGGNYYNLPPAACWLVWDKENGKNDFADAELVWTNLKKAVRLKRYRWAGMLKAEPEHRAHPTQKPLKVMKWCIGHAPAAATTILDPYMGSGTTLRAAKDLGRQAIGIEIDEAYCEIAANRMAQEVLF